MPKRVSVKLAVDNFQVELGTIRRIAQLAPPATPNKASVRFFTRSMHEYAIIRLHSVFEQFMLEALVGAINNTPAEVEKVTGVRFPRNLTADVCEFLVTGGSYFDVRGRDGLIRTLLEFLPPSSYLVSTVRDRRFKESLEKLWALRNFAVHRSAISKERALAVTGGHYMSSAGAWLSKYNRFSEIADDIELLAADIKVQAPY